MSDLINTDYKFTSAAVIPAEPQTSGREQATIVGWYAGGEAVIVLQYFADEIFFTQDEIVGKSFRECQDLFTRKDIAYLQS